MNKVRIQYRDAIRLWRCVRCGQRALVDVTHHGPTGSAGMVTYYHGRQEMALVCRACPQRLQPLRGEHWRPDGQCCTWRRSSTVQLAAVEAAWRLSGEVGILPFRVQKGGWLPATFGTRT